MMPEAGGGGMNVRVATEYVCLECMPSNKVAKGRIVRQLPVLTLHSDSLYSTSSSGANSSHVDTKPTSE